MPKPTTTEIGEKFARQVFDIIRLKYPDAKREHLVGTKKVDIQVDVCCVNEFKHLVANLGGYAGACNRLKPFPGPCGLVVLALDLRLFGHSNGGS